jgi:uncharacterized hydrophobic protein (TIGR00271 family)
MRFEASNDVSQMREAVFFEGLMVHRKLSRFWVLLALAAIIASAGVVGDSTATVIGAMIVAPLMTPILGTMLSVILADHPNLIRSITLVLGGALLAVAIGFLVGLLVVTDVVAETNSQVAGRVNPRLIDLLAALATGVVGSVALVRSDISDTLPGVAIAISLVPPLTVVGLTLEAGAYDQSMGALLLFLTNVTAILASGIVVMALYGIHRLAATRPVGDEGRVNRKRAILLISILAIVIMIPLTGASYKIATERQREANVQAAAEAFGALVGWEVVDVSAGHEAIELTLEGPLPVPDTALLRTELEARGVDVSTVRVELVPVEVVEFD